MGAKDRARRKRKAAAAAPSATWISLLPDPLLIQTLRSVPVPGLCRMHRVSACFATRKFGGESLAATRLNPHAREEYRTVVQEAARLNLMAFLETHPSSMMLRMPGSPRDLMALLMRLECRGLAVAHPMWRLSASGREATMISGNNDEAYAAVCGEVMSCGKHYATFELTGYTATGTPRPGSRRRCARATAAW